jgi:hypothetical protein
VKIRPEFAENRLLYNFLSRHDCGRLIRAIDLFKSIASGAEENLDYGNLHVLNEYAGVPIGLPILGRIQHGWVVRNKSETYYTNNFMSTFVWSTKSLTWARDLGWRNFEAIGAPWLYLLENLKSDGWVPDSSGAKLNATIDELWIPGLHQVSIESGFDSDVSEFLSKANSSKAKIKLVLLSYIDFDRLPNNVRSLYPNLEIVTLGHRRGSSSSNSHLVRIFHLLMNSKKIVIDFPTSLALYAMSVGSQIEWLKNNSYEQGLTLCDKTQNLELKAILEGEIQDTDLLKRYSLKALGSENLKTPEEIRRIFRWDAYVPFKLVRLFHSIWIFLLLPKRTLQTIKSKSKGDFRL